MGCRYRARGCAESPSDWKADFRLDPAQQKRLAQAAEESFLDAVDAARRALAAIPVTEDAYWDGLGGFQTPTQQAKLFPKGKQDVTCRLR